MSSMLTNLVILVCCWILVTGAGIYVTYVKQPDELEQVKKAEQVARMSQAEFTTLQAERETAYEQVSTAARRWQARYKTIPETLTSPEVIGQLNALTQRGFKNFDITLNGTVNQPDVNAHRFTITGRGYFSSLYRFIWDIETSRNLYRIHNLQLSHLNLTEEDPNSGTERMEVLVSFTMQLEAYFGSLPGAQADVRHSGDGDALPLIPTHVLPDRQPALNPFFPIVMEQLPPNTHDLVDVEQDELVAIVGDGAVFKHGEEFRTVAVGDDVYLGRILEVDLIQDRVVARLNKGGIVDEVEIHLQTGDRYRQALGALELAPINE